MSIQALRERLAALNKKMNALLAEKGSQTWTKEDQAVFDADSDEAERLQRQIEATKKQLDRDAEENFRDVERKPGNQKKTELQNGLDIFLRKSVREMTAEEALMVRNTMSTTTGSEGGYTVQPQIAGDVIDAIKSYGAMRRVSQSFKSAKGADLSYPTSDGTSEMGEIVTQNTPSNAQDISFGTRALNVFKFGSKVIAVPIELLQDSEIDIQSLVYKRIRQRIGRIQNVNFSSTGTGTGSPMALTAAASVGVTGTTGQTTTIIYDNLVDLVDSLDADYLGEGDGDGEKDAVAPGWMFSQTLRRVVRKIKDTAGRPIWTPSYDEGMASKTPDRLLGFPVYINNDMPTPAANAKSLAFGALDRYMIRDAMEVQLFRFDDSTYISKGQIGFLAWARAGGNLMDTAAVKTYQHSAT